MHRHRVATAELEKGVVALDHAGARHFLNVLRLKGGDEVELFDGLGASATFRLREPQGRQAELERVGAVRRAQPPRCRLVLGACVSKGKRMDWTIEKAVELGVSEIVPILSRNSVVKVESAADAEDKRLRWERVAIDAARQCSSAFVPAISTPLPFGEALSRIAASSRMYVGALTSDAIPLRDALARDRGLPPPASVAWLIGPEGDFSPEEYGALRAAGASMVSLGSLVLRTETAAIYGLCVFGSEWL